MYHHQSPVVNAKLTMNSSSDFETRLAPFARKSKSRLALVSSCTKQDSLSSNRLRVEVAPLSASAHDNLALWIDSQVLAFAYPMLKLDHFGTIRRNRLHNPLGPFSLPSESMGNWSMLATDEGHGLISAHVFKKDSGTRIQMRRANGKRTMKTFSSLSSQFYFTIGQNTHVVTTTHHDALNANGTRARTQLSECHERHFTHSSSGSRRTHFANFDKSIWGGKWSKANPLLGMVLRWLEDKLCKLTPSTSSAQLSSCGMNAEIFPR